MEMRGIKAKMPNMMARRGTYEAKSLNAEILATMSLPKIAKNKVNANQTIKKKILENLKAGSILFLATI